MGILFSHNSFNKLLFFLHFSSDPVLSEILQNYAFHIKCNVFYSNMILQYLYCHLLKSILYRDFETQVNITDYTYVMGDNGFWFQIFDAFDCSFKPQTVGFWVCSLQYSHLCLLLSNYAIDHNESAVHLYITVILIRLIKKWSLLEFQKIRKV